MALFVDHYKVMMQSLGDKLESRSFSKVEMHPLSSGPFSEVFPVDLVPQFGLFEKCIGEMHSQVFENLM